MKCMVYVETSVLQTISPDTQNQLHPGDISGREAVTPRARGGLKINWRKRTPMKERITFWRNSYEVYMTGNGKFLKKVIVME